MKATNQKFNHTGRSGGPLWFWCVVVCFGPSWLAAQESKTIDLAVMDAGVMHFLPISGGKSYNFELFHVIPSEAVKYQVKIEKEPNEPGVLPLPAEKTKESKELFVEQILCKDALRNLGSAKSEKAVKDTLDWYIMNGCDKKLLEMKVTKSIPDIISINKGDKLNVTIKRFSQQDTLTWTIVYKSDPPGKWMVNYGFTFVPDWLSSSGRFFVQEDASGTFQIVESTSQKGLEYVPSVFYTWVPYRMAQKCWIVPSISGGLGFDLENPTVMLAFSLTCKYNLSLHTGVMAIKKDLLKGKYAEGQIITENLDFDQLHEKVYRPELFVSLAFRFGENPFKKDE